MNIEELRVWQDCVLEHCHAIDVLRTDRDIVKDTIVSHIKQFFEPDEIVFSEKFDVITLKFRESSPIIHTNIGELGMEWEICNEFDSESLSHCIFIKLYPFGVED